MTTKDLFEELTLAGGCGCSECVERKEAICKELETSIRKEVVEDILKLEENQFIYPEDVKEYALSKGINIK